MTDLHAASREELIELIYALLEKVERLEARVAELEEENRRLRQGRGGGSPIIVKASRPVRECKERKRRERSFVRRREPADQEVRHALERCPECGQALHGGWEHSRRQTIEVELHKRVVDHIRVARRCGACGVRCLPPWEEQKLGAQGKRRFGASVQSLVTVLHVAGRIPIRMIRQMLKESCDLHISDGAMIDLLDGVKMKAEPAVAEILAGVRTALAVCGDETGWRQDGENGYLWGFFTEKERYFEYRKSRAAQVPKDILGEEFGGTLICDFYGAYNWVGLLQRCWSHLLADAKELAELNADRPETVAWVEALRALYREAKACCLELEPLPPEHRMRQQQRRRLERLAAKLARPYANYPDAPQQVLCQRLLKYLSELFVFVSNPTVPADNNLAERSLRPAVIARKIRGGTRSAKGSDTYMKLMSLLATWRAQGKGLLQGCREILLPTPAP
jgi:hypothetical protein